MKQRYYFLERHYRIIYALFVFGSLFLYLPLTFGHSFWYDEAYTLELVKHRFSEIWEITAADVHPPLYYILLKIFLIPFGDSMFMAEVFSMIPFVLIIAIGGFQLKKLFDAETAVLFMFLFFLFPYTMSYAVEIRMYSLAALFVFLTAIYAFRCQSREERKWQDWGKCAFFGACAAYTHYFALVSVGIIYGLLLFAVVAKSKRSLKNWIFMVALTAVLYLPWLNCFWEQLVYKATHEYWISPVTVKTVLSYAYEIFGSKGVFAFVLFSGSCYAAALVYILWKKNREDILIALCALAVPCCTIFIGVAASVIVRPVFIARYCISSIPLLVFFMAFVLRKIWDAVLPFIFLTVFLIGGIGNYGEFIVNGLCEHQIGFEDLMPEECDIPKSIVAYGTSGAIRHATGVLAYYYPETAIYRTNFHPSKALPFTNFYEFRDFNPEENQSILLLTEPNQKIPLILEAEYVCQYIGEADRYEWPVDVYLLWH